MVRTPNGLSDIVLRPLQSFTGAGAVVDALNATFRSNADAATHANAEGDGSVSVCGILLDATQTRPGVSHQEIGGHKRARLSRGSPPPDTQLSASETGRYEPVRGFSAGDTVCSIHFFS